MSLRKLFLFTLALGLLAAPLAADAQPPAKVARIGYLSNSSPTGHRPFAEAFRQGLREHGWIEGQNIAIEWRFAEGTYDRLPSLASELVRLKVDVIVATATVSVLAAKDATRTIPIVFTGVGDPVGSGLVKSLARPGGNLTGVSRIHAELAGKRLELLKETFPRVSHVAVLWNLANPAHAARFKETQVAAQALRVTLEPVEVRAPDELEDAFARMARAGAGALLVLADTMLYLQRGRIAQLAVKNHLPTMFPQREFVDSGGLMAYGARAVDDFRRAAYYVDKILKGAKPADLPVEQPMRFELVINLKTAKALGLTIPQSVLFRADQVIQ